MHSSSRLVSMACRSVLSATSASSRAMRSSRAGLKTEAGEASTVPPGHGKPAQPGQLPGAAEEPTGPFKTTGEVDDATAPSDSECVICLGELSIVGKLECCSHTFCFDCIMEWSKTENRCPMCRKRFTTLTKVDLNEQSKSQSSSSKGKTRRRPPAKIKIQTRDQNQSMRYGHDEAHGAHHFLLDPFFTEFFDPIFLNAGPPAWLERRRGRHDRISELVPEHRVGHVPPVDHLFMPDFHLFMAAEDEEDDDDEQQPGRRHAMHHPHTAGVGHLPPHREPRMHDGRPSTSGPGRRQVEHVIEFSQRIRYSTGGAQPPSSRGGASSSTAQAPASSRGASSSAALAAAAGASSSSSSAAAPRAGRSSSSRGANSSAAMVAGTIFDPVVLDDDDDDEPEVSIVGTRRPAVPAQQPPRAPALRGAAVSFHDFPPFLLGGPLLDPAALMMGDPDQHWVDFFSQGPAPRARALGRPEPMSGGPAAPGPASSSSRRRLGASSSLGRDQDWADFFRDTAARARAPGLPEPMQPAAPGPASSSSSSAAHARGQPSSSSSSSSRRRPASEALAVEQSLLGEEEASEEAHGEAGGRQKRRRRR